MRIPSANTLVIEVSSADSNEAPGTPATHAPEKALPEVTRSGIYLAIHRFEDSVYYRRIDREEFLLLADLRDGDSIATAIERAFEGSKLAVVLQGGRVQDYFAHTAELGSFCLSKPPQTKGAQPSETYTHFY